MNLSPGGNQYVVHVVNFPGGVHAAVATTGDDIYHVFINDQLSPAARREALDHELRHIDENHLYNDILPIGYMEQVARGQIPPEPHSPQEWGSSMILDPRHTSIPYYPSLRAYRDYVFHDKRLEAAYRRLFLKEGGPDKPKPAEPEREDG